MNDDTDPMLGDEATQTAYKATIKAAMQEEADRTREARRAAAEFTPSATVIVGAEGFGPKGNKAL